MLSPHSTGKNNLFSSGEMKSLLLFLVILSMALRNEAQLQVGYYNGKCKGNDVESVIRGVVTQRFLSDHTIVAGLLRMIFHDCFVNGCDGSVLLDGSNSEKTAIPNLTLFGFDLINQVKSALENLCPGVVSCADIIMAATRDATVLAGGVQFDVQLGRRDGPVSYSWQANSLPRPDISVPDATNLFQSKGLNTWDMVLLMGGHTVGVTHCSVIHDRLYNYQGTGKPDPTMLPWYVWMLQTYTCPAGLPWDNQVFLDDYSSAYIVDNNYYKQLLANKGILGIDQELTYDWTTAWIVQFLAESNYFPYVFSQALVKLGTVGVLTGSEGQIRKVCNSVN